MTEYFENMKSHPMYGRLVRGLTDALLVDVQDDVAAVKGYLRQTKKLTEKQINYMLSRKRSTWVQQRIRRVAAGPDIQIKRLTQCFQSFKDVTHFDAKLGKTVPLLGSRERKICAAILKLARDGFLSDLPHVKLYFPLPPSIDGLPRWRCARGSSSVEGWHKWYAQPAAPDTAYHPSLTCVVSFCTVGTTEHCIVWVLLAQNLLIWWYLIWRSGTPFANHSVLGGWFE